MAPGSRAHRPEAPNCTLSTGSVMQIKKSSRRRSGLGEKKISGFFRGRFRTISD
jgi:hypothetical protein